MMFRDVSCYFMDRAFITATKNDPRINKKNHELNQTQDYLQQDAERRLMSMGIQSPLGNRKSSMFVVV